MDNEAELGMLCDENDGSDEWRYDGVRDGIVGGGSDGM